MQALHRKLDVVLVQILPYNCSETDQSFCEDSPPQSSTRIRVSPSDPFSLPPLFFFAPQTLEELELPDIEDETLVNRTTKDRFRIIGVVILIVSYQVSELTTQSVATDKIRV